MWSDHVGDLEPQGLHPQVVAYEVPVDAQAHHLVEPRNEHLRVVFAQAQDLRWLCVQGVGEPSGVETVLEERGVLPPHSIERIVAVEIDRGDRDVPSGSEP